MISNRSLILTYYEQTDGEDHIFIISSKGNKHLEDKLKDRIGNDVVATLDINFMKFSPKYDSCGDLIGTEISQVVSFDPAGDLPDILKTTLTKLQANAMVTISEHIRKTKG